MVERWVLDSWNNGNQTCWNAAQLRDLVRYFEKAARLGFETADNESITYFENPDKL